MSVRKDETFLPPWKGVPSTGVPLAKPDPQQMGVDTLAPDSPERMRKGDLGLNVIPGFDSKPLSRPGVPWKDLKDGKRGK